MSFFPLVLPLVSTIKNAVCNGSFHAEHFFFGFFIFTFLFVCAFVNLKLFNIIDTPSEKIEGENTDKNKTRQKTNKQINKQTKQNKHHDHDDGGQNALTYTCRFDMLQYGSYHFTIATSLSDRSLTGDFPYYVRVLRDKLTRCIITQ